MTGGRALQRQTERPAELAAQPTLSGDTDDTNMSIAPFRSFLGTRPPRNDTDLLERARLAFLEDRAANLPYRQQAIRRAFFERFGVAIGELKPANNQIQDIWTFVAIGLAWITSDDGHGDERHVWFCVRDSEGGRHEASTLHQLGELVARGVPFERVSS